jgi:type II secretory pathway pseudopilin PulG
LIELLVVLSVLILIIVIAVPRYRHVTKSSEKEVCRANCELAEDAWQMSVAQDPEMSDEARMEEVFMIWG